MAKYFYVSKPPAEADGQRKYECCGSSAAQAKRVLKADAEYDTVSVEHWYRDDLAGCEEYSRDEFLAVKSRDAEAGHTNHRAHLYGY